MEQRDGHDGRAMDSDSNVESLALRENLPLTRQRPEKSRHNWDQERQGLLNARLCPSTSACIPYTSLNC